MNEHGCNTRRMFFQNGTPFHLACQAKFASLQLTNQLDNIYSPGTEISHHNDEKQKNSKINTLTIDHIRFDNQQICLFCQLIHTEKKSIK